MKAYLSTTAVSSITINKTCIISPLVIMQVSTIQVNAKRKLSQSCLNTPNSLVPVIWPCTLYFEDLSLQYGKAEVSGRSCGMNKLKTYDNRLLIRAFVRMNSDNGVRQEFSDTGHVLMRRLHFRAPDDLHTSILRAKNSLGEFYFKVKSRNRPFGSSKTALQNPVRNFKESHRSYLSFSSCTTTATCSLDELAECRIIDRLSEIIELARRSQIEM